MFFGVPEVKFNLRSNLSLWSSFKVSVGCDLGSWSEADHWAQMRLLKTHSCFAFSVSPGSEDQGPHFLADESSAIGISLFLAGFLHSRTWASAFYVLPY